MVANLSDKGKVLVVGAMPRNLPEYTDHPRIILWGSDIKGRCGQVPSGVEVVLFTKFMSHSWCDKIKASCSENVFVNNQVLGTGEVKKILLSLGIEPKRKEKDLIHQKPIGINFVPQRMVSSINVSASVAEDINTGPTSDDGSSQTTPVKSKSKLGVLKEFVLLHGDPNCLVVAQEAKRLLEIAKKEGIATTFHSLEQSVRNYLKKKPIKESSSVVSEPASQDKPAQKSDESLNALQKLVEHISETKVVAELAMVAVLEIKEEYLGLKRELQDLRGENERLKEVEVRLAKLKEVLG